MIIKNALICNESFEFEKADIEIENEKIKGKIQIVKTSSNDSPILGIKEGESLYSLAKY